MSAAGRRVLRSGCSGFYCCIEGYPIVSQRQVVFPQFTVNDLAFSLIQERIALGEGMSLDVLVGVVADVIVDVIEFSLGGQSAEGLCRQQYTDHQ